MKKILLSILISFFCISTAQADLLLTPYHAIIEGRDRSANIIVVNTGTETNTYRLSWLQLKQAEGLGGYLEEDVSDGKLRLQDFAVFTPRQITLEPGEKQTVRIGIRRPAELDESEYKSHLKFQVIPKVRKKLPDPTNPNAVSFGAGLFISQSVPIIYRVGEYDIDIQIGNPEFVVNEKTGNLDLKLPVSRSGKHGSIGIIRVYHRANGESEEREITSTSGANMFPEITNRNFTIPTKERGLRPGILTVRFLKGEGVVAKETVIAERSFPIQN